jgi:hypothetical protein
VVSFHQEDSVEALVVPTAVASEAVWAVSSHQEDSVEVLVAVPMAVPTAVPTVASEAV